MENLLCDPAIQPNVSLESTFGAGRRTRGPLAQLAWRLPFALELDLDESCLGFDVAVRGDGLFNLYA